MPSEHSGGPAELLRTGASAVEPSLGALGYRGVDTLSGHGSGGDFAMGRYERPDRAIELHVRFDLLKVIYEIGGERIDHRDWAAFRGLRSSYPGFSEHPLSSFEHLALDLEGPFQPLAEGREDEAFMECAAVLREDPQAFRRPFLP